MWYLLLTTVQHATSSRNTKPPAQSALSFGWFRGFVWLRFGRTRLAWLFDCRDSFGFGCFGLLLFEAVHSSGSVNQVLFTGIERMAFAAYFCMECFFSRAGLPRVTTSASHSCCSKICWVDAVLHMEVLNSAYSIADSCFFRQGMVK